MKNYGLEPDSDIREIVEAEIAANDQAASGLEKNAADLRAQADKLAHNAAWFRAGSETLRNQLVLLKAVLDKKETA